ncbi:hypothetical protein [Shewanella acanthi]|uniref:hypothetical protein n=1 Tax=Shewanella acanthi TaxID=2864212 RepID=UPI001C65C002|nr:hypothetical protein [Shewanella acanthi]QYJ79696.1 hypothetical protein K0H61_04475 [Shewanella acanthi]
MTSTRKIAVHKGVALANKFGFLGLFGILLGLVGAVIGFDYSETKTFNFLNHTLSELGTYGHSSSAVVLNGGLFFGSLSIAFYCLSSLQNVTRFWGYPFFVFMTLTFLALSSIGLFPVNVYHLHILGLKWFFYFGSLSAVCYLIWAGLSPLPARGWNVLLALMVFVSMMTFLYAPQLGLGLTEGDRPFYQEMVVQLPRPELWWPALLEWVGLASLLAWTLMLLVSGTSLTQD